MSLTRSESNGSPARLIVRTDAGIAFMRMSSLMTLGTVFISVGELYVSVSASARVLASSRTLPPVESAAKISNIDRSKQIEVPANVRANSWSSYADCAQEIRLTAFRWRIFTPLGRPDEPEV